MAGIRIEAVTKQFAGGVKAIDELSLTIRDGEFVVFVGPSGCGKTTLLRMVAGLEQVSEGRILIGDQDVTALPARDRNIAMVFQDYALYPFLTVEKNLGFGLKLQRKPRAEIGARVREVAQMLELTTLLERTPGELSGGQRQRVAMGRAMIREPLAFLMDEPLSNLDAKLRVQMRSELARLRDRLERTTVYVTHDQVEAMTLGDRVVVLRDGKVQQFDAPEVLFTHPANVFVASFIGSPTMNLAEGQLESDRVVLGGMRIPLPAGVTELETYIGQTVIVGVRPSAFTVGGSAPSAGRLSVEIVPDVVERLGEDVHVVFAVGAAAPKASEQATGQTVQSASPEWAAGPPREAVFTARVDATHEIRRGRPLRVEVDHARLYLFDATSGHLIWPTGRQPSGAVPREAARIGGATR